MFEEIDKLDLANNDLNSQDLMDTKVQSYVYYFPKNNVEEIVRLYNFKRKKISNVLEKNIFTNYL